MSRISETPKGVLETYDWQDVAEDLQEQLQEANESITWWKDRWTAQVNLRKECFEENEQLRTELNTLKSDIDKAVKYIKENKLYNFSYDKEEIFYTVSDKKARNKLLSILDGDQ